jgi:hypothetical protein
MGSAGKSNNNDGESESEFESDSNSSEDDQAKLESKKANEQYLQEIRETKLREARKILFGDFAVI